MVGGCPRPGAAWGGCGAVGRCWGAAGASEARRAACFLSSPVGAPENLNWIWCVIYFNSEPLYGCFRALPRYDRWLAMGPKTPPYIYTIPIPYRVADPVANQRRKCICHRQTICTRRFEHLFVALASWPTLRALAKAAVSLQATLLQQRQAILGATPRRAEGYSSGVRSDTDARRRDERREAAATELPRSSTPPRRRRQKQR